MRAVRRAGESRACGERRQSSGQPGQTSGTSVGPPAALAAAPGEVEVRGAFRGKFMLDTCRENAMINLENNIVEMSFSFLHNAFTFFSSIETDGEAVW